MYSKGNPLTYDGYSYSWVNGRQLSKITKGSNTYQYKYNENGIRISKSINNKETKYYLEGSNIIYEDRNGEIIYYFYDSSGVAGFEYLGNKYYYVKNLQGDIIEIIDSSYQTVAKYTYDAFGNPIDILDGNGVDVSGNANHIANTNPMRYRSYYFDTETGLYYLNARYYNSDWGRFINADGIVGANQDILAYNLYAYCSNNPVNNDDPTGNASIKSLWNNFKKGFVNLFKGQVNTVKAEVVAIKKNPIKKLLVDNAIKYNPVTTAVNGLKGYKGVAKFWTDLSKGNFDSMAYYKIDLLQYNNDMKS